MSDSIEFLMKYGTADQVRKIVHAPRVHNIDNKDWALQTSLKNPACPTDVVDQAANSKHQYMRRDALRHPNVSPETHQRALKSHDPDIRLSAWHSPLTTIEQLKHAAENDPSEWGPINARNILRDRLK